MRYHINFQKLVNRFVPHYMGGRNLILYLQSCVQPLQAVSDTFSDYAKETRIEASMTSQIFKLEWFLNRKFSKYFANPGERISIKNGEKLGTPIYYQSATIDKADNLVLYTEKDNPREGTVLYHADDTTSDSSHSFTVNSPKIDTAKISLEAYDAMLSYYVDKYKISSKSYIIKHND